MTWRERWRELRRIWNGERRPVVLTAVGWKPPGDEWTEDPNPTPSGTSEYYKVIRPAGAIEKEYSHEQETSRADRRQNYRAASRQAAHESDR